MFYQMTHLVQQHIVDSSGGGVLTAHNADGAIVAVDTEGPFDSEKECKAVGAAVTKRVYEVISSFQPETHSAMEWDRLTTSCEAATSP